MPLAWDPGKAAQHVERLRKEREGLEETQVPGVSSYANTGLGGTVRSDLPLPLAVCFSPSSCKVCEPRSPSMVGKRHLNVGPCGAGVSPPARFLCHPGCSWMAGCLSCHLLGARRMQIHSRISGRKA